MLTSIDSMRLHGSLVAQDQVAQDHAQDSSCPHSPGSMKSTILISTEIASYLAPVGVTLMWSFNRALARIASSRKVLSPRV